MPDPGGSAMLAADAKLESVYGSRTYDNGGVHLSGGVADNTKWVGFHDKLLQSGRLSFWMPNSYHKSVGKRLTHKLANILEAWNEGKCNFEMIYVFLAVTLQRDPGRKTTSEASAKIKQRLEKWLQGKHLQLVEEACRNMEALQTLLRSKETTDNVNCRVNNLVLNRKLQQAARLIINNNSSCGVLDLDLVDKKRTRLFRKS